MDSPAYDNGILLRTCAEHHMVLTNTFCIRCGRRRPGYTRGQDTGICWIIPSPGVVTNRTNELDNRLANILVASEDASVENRWCQLRNTVQSTTLDVLGRAPHQHQDWFYDNDATINTQTRSMLRFSSMAPPS
ncbi:unnamed protein product [Schistocephalus solidus]|uniref:OrfB_Zn_ribbon domain-containing protein n=1 Tax=Schistocephalus solidus TaxID=70667 RepID=A0A183T0X7_SCHSO|nr:unnamed protein product [Schistocephalus solidus]